MDWTATKHWCIDAPNINVKPALRVLLKWMIARYGCSGSVITDVIPLEEHESVYLDFQHWPKAF